MTYYVINKNKDTDGHNEVHKTSCAYCPSPINAVGLGYYNNAGDAVKYAKNSGWSAADGCYHCSREAHKG